MRLKINWSKKRVENTNSVNNVPLNNQWITDEIRGNKICIGKMTTEAWWSKIYRTQQNASKREVHSSIILPQETRKNLKQPILKLKQLEKEGQTKPKVIRRKEIIKIRVGINKIEM